MKRFLKSSLSLVLALTIVLSSALVGLGEIDFGSVFAIKASAASESDLTFKLNADGESYCVTDCNISAAGEITMPSTYNGLPVTSIGSSAFSGCTSLTSVIIPDTVTLIDNGAFSGCTSLKSIDLPDSILKLGSGDYCTGVFQNCTSLKEVKMPKYLEHLGENTFNGCIELEEIFIPKTVKSTGYYGGALSNCDKLKKITIEDGMTTIPADLFSKCKSIEEIIIPDTVTLIDNGAFSGCTSLKSIDLPNNILKLGKGAFSNCTSLKSINIPNSKIEFGNNVLFGCSALETVNLPENTDKVTSGMFQNCESLKSINIPEKVKTIQSSAFCGCSSLSEINIPEKLESIGNNAFENCVALERINIPKYVNSIGSQAFMGCEALSTVDIADYSIQEIKTDTFKDCPGLNRIVLPKGLTKIGRQAFMNDTGLTEVVIPESVTSIDSTAFSYPAKTTIYGKNGSYAQTFATEGGFNFSENLIPVEGIILKDGVENVTLDVGETYRAEFEVFPEDANEVIVLTADNNNVSITGHDIYARYTGDTLITATATNGLSCEFNVHIRSANSIAITKQPTKLSYLMGESLDLSGMEIQVFYNDESVKTITDYTVSGFDSSVEGTSTVTVQWTAVNGSKYTTTFDVEIVDPNPKVTGIFIEVLPTKVQYELREKLDLTGMVVKANYTDGSVKEITDYTTSGYNALKNAAQVITVTYNGFTTNFTVFVGDVPTEHSYGDWVIDTEATCTKPGSRHKTCSTCGDVVTETIPEKGHDYSTQWTIDKAANCTEYGSKSHHCLNCDDKTDITVIAPTGHNYSDWYVDKDAGCTEDGSKHKECTVCGEVLETEVIAKTGHKSSDWITDKEATVNSAGSKHKECTVCGEVLETETIPQLTCSTPNLTKIENTSNGIKITWGKVTGAQSYNVYRKTYSNGKWSGWSGIKYGVTSTSYTDTTAKSGVYYTYTVRAKNAAGLSSYNTTGLKLKYLSTPKLTSISNGSGKVTVKWNKVTGASGYYVYRSTYSNGKWSGWKKVATTSNNYYNDTKVSSGNYYKYTVRAYNGNYISYYNTTGLKTKYLAVAPLKSAVSQSAGVKVTWGKVTGAKGYNIYRQTYSNGKWSGWSKVATVKSGSTVSYTDKSAKKGVTYKYTVRAISDSYIGYYNTKGLQVKDKY